MSEATLEQRAMWTLLAATPHEIPSLVAHGVGVYFHSNREDGDAKSTRVSCWASVSLLIGKGIPQPLEIL